MKQIMAFVNWLRKTWHDQPSDMALGVALVLAFASLVVYATWLYLYDCQQQKPDCDLTNLQSLTVEGIVFGGGLGSFFYFLQRRSSHKTEQLIEDVSEYVRENKKLIANITGGYLRSVRIMLTLINEDFKREKKLIDQQTDASERDRFVFAYVKGTRELHTKRIDQIEPHVSFLRAYVKPATIDDIESAIYRVRHLCKEPKIPDFHNVESWLTYVGHHIEETDRVCTNLERLIKENDSIK
jgi:hypothetical protein